MILRKGRLDKELQEKIALFTTSVRKDADLAEYDIRQSRVHARALCDAGYITEDDLNQIDSALDRARDMFRSDPGNFGSGHDDIHMAVEAFIGDPGKKLHAGRSRNDQVACDMRMYLRDSADRIIKGLEACIEALREKDSESDGRRVYMPAYTHLQRAQAVDLTTYLGVYINWFGRDIQRFRDLRKRINMLPLGSAAGASTGIKLNREKIASELGFDGVMDNPMDAVSSRDYIVEFACACATLGVHFSRLAEEFILFSSREYSFIELDESISETSSIMPQKKNPDCLELIRSSSGRITGTAVGLLTVMKGLPLTYNRDMQDDRMVFEASRTAEAVTGLLPDILGGITFRPENMKRAAQEGFTDAADLAEYLVTKGMGFRDAHQAVASLAREGVSRGYRNFSEYPTGEMKERIPAVEDDVLEYIKMENSVARRLYQG